MLFDGLDHPTFETFDIRGRLALLEETGTKKTRVPVDRVAGRARFGAVAAAGNESVEGEADDLLVFTSNNFLGLAGDDRVIAAAQDAAENVGTGAGASRVSTGDTIAHRTLESDLADVKNTDDALVFSSGYAANLGTITCLYPNVIFSDEYNHTSIIEGARTANAEVVVYDHCDPTDLAAKMEAQRARSDGDTEKWLVVTDSVFSMDGDVAPLEALCDVADEYGAWMMVDEAHATGIYGENAGGIAQDRGVSDRIEIQMGTLSKALGSQGGYVAGDAELIEYVATSARSFVFSTGLNPPAAGAARRALEIARDSDRPARLLENAEFVRNALDERGFETWGEGHIVPVIVGDPTLARDASAMLWERGIRVNNVPYPAVPPGTSRLRVIPLATHTQRDLERFVDALETVGRELGVVANGDEGK